MIRLIGLTGAMGSGKSTAAEYLREQGWVEQMFATPFKEACKIIWGFSDEQLYGPSHLRNVHDRRHLKNDGTYLTPREALQKLGTYGRGLVEDVWVNAARRKWNKTIHGGRCVVISDVRFDNEAEAVREAGGKIIKLHRNGPVISAHASERGIDPALVNYGVSNKGTKQELYKILCTILTHIGHA